ncbi:MAG: DNA-binding domain-containing protein [Gammaproteobacteria bacterium]|nr:MAG: DNA-binding domain-containing protein [Gammaproteobacteria bacterium]
MPALRELQRRLIASILAEDNGSVLPWIGAHGLPASERLSVYRNTCRENFLVALATGYPVLRRLTGEAYFRQLAQQYQQAHPSPSGNLGHAGARLPGFLGQRFAATEFAYFADVARLEWLCQEVLSAADRKPLDLQRLGEVSAADHARLRFTLDPAARLLTSRFPVVTIWEAHQQPGEPAPIDLATGGEQALVQRRRAGITVFRLQPAEYACLDALDRKQPLGAAMEDGLRGDPSFDLGAALRRWAEAGVIAAFDLPDETGQSA